MSDFLQDYPDGVILALDEMSLYFQATLTRVWSPVGYTPIVDVHPQRDHIHFYGALNLRNGREIAMSTPEQTALTTIHFLIHLLHIYSQPILLLFDRAPWHYGEVTSFIQEVDRLQIVRFPVACPHLNPQEHVWAQARDKISHNHGYRQFQPLIADFETYLNETPFTTHFMDAYTPLGLGVF